MKKILLIIILIILLATFLVYVFIPHTITVSSIVYANNNSTSVLRGLHNDTAWAQWFPGKRTNKNTLSYNNQIYKPGLKTYTSNAVVISDNNNKSYPSEINVLPISFDSSAIQWQLQFTASNNPFKRIQQYQSAKKIKYNINTLLDSFKQFISYAKNIYGFDIKYTTLTDTALVSIRTVIHEYPSTDMIYKMIDQLKQYIKQQHAIEHNYPMLNITKQRDSNYEVSVGIPTNILLQGNELIKPKRMMMIKNKTLVTEVIGDTGIIKKALAATADFMRDNQLAPPVIPFQQLVTDRSKLKDSTKWVTRIFSPIM